MEWRVGVFVAIGIVLLAAVTLNFSKSLSSFKKTYRLRLRAENVGGIKDNAMVLLSGVKVGSVIDATLSTNGTVVIGLRIYNEFKIDRQARFLIDSAGFLGDQYVAIVSTNNSGEFLKNGDEVICEPPLNLQEAMRSTAGLLQQAQSTMRTLDAAVSNVNRAVLNDATLMTFAGAISNLQAISGDASKTLGKLDRLISSNSPVVSASVSNLFDFTAGLKVVLATNQNEILSAMTNLHRATVTVNELLDDVKQTNGAAGLLLRDEQTKAELAALVSNLNSATANFGVFSSNLNRRGIWSMLWKPKVEKPKREKFDPENRFPREAN